MLRTRTLDISLVITASFIVAACVDVVEPTFEERGGEAEAPAEQKPGPEKQAKFSCAEELNISVGGLYYPGLDCAAAIADAQANFNSWHYRNGCADKVGSDIDLPVDDALVTDCSIDGDSAVVTVDVCCTEPVLTCHEDLQASVGGLHYPGWTCADAIADAEANLASWHYRNGCNLQVGSDINDPIDQANVTSCTIVGDNAVVEVDMCCASPLSCDPDSQASVGGLHYPGWTCAAAIADAESSFNSWHYRNGCNQQQGSDINDPVNDAHVTSCSIVGDNAVVEVDVCCEPALACDWSEQASVSGLHYPGWTCAAAIAHAEADFNSGHYRNACHQQQGSNINTPVGDAHVTDCTIVGNNAVVAADVCCQ